MRALVDLQSELSSLHGDDDATQMRIAQLLNAIAAIKLREMQFDEAEEAARRSLQCAARAKEVSSEHVATYQFMLAGILAERGRFEEAALFAESAVATFKKNHGEADPFVSERRRDLVEMRKRKVRRYIER